MDNEVTTRRSSMISAVERAVMILERLVGERHGLGVTDLSEALAIAPSITSRILTTLQAQGLVYQEPKDDRFHLTYKLLRMAYAHSDSLDIGGLFSPYMEKLAQRSGELVQLAVVDGHWMTVLLKVEGTQRLRVTSMLGHQIPLHASACGKAWLAHLDDQQVFSELGRRTLTPFTEKTITRIEDLVSEFKLIRRRGYAIEAEEWTDGVISVAAPVFVKTGDKEDVVAAIMVSLPSVHVGEQRIDALAEMVKEAARTMGLAWPPYLVSHIRRKDAAGTYPSASWASR